MIVALFMAVLISLCVWSHFAREKNGWSESRSLTFILLDEVDVDRVFLAGRNLHWWYFAMCHNTVCYWILCANSSQNCSDIVFDDLSLTIILCSGPCGGFHSHCGIHWKKDEDKWSETTNLHQPLVLLHCDTAEFDWLRQSIRKLSAQLHSWGVSHQTSSCVWVSTDKATNLLLLQYTRISASIPLADKYFLMH